MEAANRYEILSKLAVGGMAEIFLARSTSTLGVSRHVVLKRIHAEHADDQQFAQMFLDEARLAAQLQHPNIAQVFDVGKLGESVFFTMEYVHGETLRTILQHIFENNLELALPFILTAVAGTAAGLHHAHERLGMDGRPLGIVHRDISPANIMTTYDGIVKIVDFGVAKATTAHHKTVAGTVKGKISYMSPEQCRGNVVDRRSDLFSLGIVMWELLTRGRLYRRQSDFDSMTAIVNEPPIPPSAYRAGLPVEIDRLVLRLLAKSPEQRHATGDELVDDLDRVAGKLNLAMNPSAIKTALRGFFGKKPEPWLAPEATDHAPITLIGEANDLYSAIEVASQPDLPAAFTTGHVTIPRVHDGQRADALLGTLQMPRGRKQPPPELDFDAATTRDLGSMLAAQAAAEPLDAFTDDEYPTMLDDRIPQHAGPRTAPMMTVAQPRSPASTPPAIVVSPALAVPSRPAQPARAPQPLTSSMLQTTPRALPASLRPSPTSDATRPVTPLPPPGATGAAPAPVTPPPSSRTALVVALLALVIVVAVITVIVLRS